MEDNDSSPDRELQPDRVQSPALQDNVSRTNSEGGAVERVANSVTKRPVMAVVAEEQGENSSKTYLPVKKKIPETDLDSEFRNLAANGGAVGGFYIGIWSVVGSLITYYSFINALVAIGLAAYGLRSRKKKLAAAGLVIALIGCVLSLLDFNQLLSDFWRDQDS